MSWVQVRWLEQRCEEGRVEKRWQEVRESEKRWDEVNRVELRWEEVNRIELRWEEMKNIENSCEKNWEGLRWCEKSCEELRSGRLSCKRVRQDDEFAEQSFEDARLHANSYRQTLSFTPTYSVTFLATGNFRHPPRAGFLCTYLTLRLIWILQESLKLVLPEWTRNSVSDRLLDDTHKWEQLYRHVSWFWTN